MCVSSMISDFYDHKWGQWPQLKPILTPEPYKGSPTMLTQEQIDKIINPNSAIGRKEFEELKKDVQDMKALMLKAIKYDAEHDQPHCEQEEKIALIRRVAELVGVDMSEVLKGLQ